MNPLAVLCPKTRRPIVSGVETDWTTLQRISSRTVRIFCSDCGEHHDVRVRDSYLAQSQNKLGATSLPQNLSLERLLAHLCLRG